MRQYKKLLVLATGACLFPVTSVMAASNASEADLESAIQKINTQTESLQQEIKELKTELRQIKQSKQTKSQVSVTEAAKKIESADGQTNNSKSITGQTNGMQPSTTLWNMPQLFASPILNLSLLNSSADLDPSAFISYQSSMSEGLFYLKQRQALENQSQTDNFPLDNRPQIMLGGKLESQASWQSPYTGSNNSAIDLTTAELEVVAQVSPWASGVFIIDYNNNPLSQALLGSGNTVNNSNLYLNNGYITLGNLNKSPVYFNMGQMYVPFGKYSSWMLTNPTTKVLGRTNTRAAELGLLKNGFNASIYAFDGAANTGDNDINDWGTDVNYKFTVGKFNAGFGAGFINNIADSQGAQATGDTEGTFEGFSKDSTTEQLVRYVPGVDIHGSLSQGPWYLAGEGITATRSYDVLDMSYNGAGAQPKAMHLETGLNFNVLGKKSIFSLSYDQTWEALAMGLPKNSYTVTLNTSIWKNTVETLEFRHDVNYASTDTATGLCNYTDSVGNVFTVCPGPVAGGGSQNTVLAQLGVYF